MITGTLGDNTTEIMIEGTSETITEMITETMMDNIIGVDSIRTNVAMILKKLSIVGIIQGKDLMREMRDL